MKVDIVLFIVASNRDIQYMMLIDFQEAYLVMYERLLDSVAGSLDWIYGVQPFPTESSGVGLIQNGYHLDLHSVHLHLQL
jgi:hypothetical protein